MAVFRKENGSLVRKAGKALIDMALNANSNNAVANKVIKAKFDEVTKTDSFELTIRSNRATIINQNNKIKGSMASIFVEFTANTSGVAPLFTVPAKGLTTGGVELTGHDMATPYSNIYGWIMENGEFDAGGITSGHTYRLYGSYIL